MWCPLLLSAMAIIRHMTSLQNDRCPYGDVAVIFEDSTFQQARALADSVTSGYPGLKFLFLDMDDHSLRKSLQDLSQVKTRLDYVLLLADSDTLVLNVFDHVMTTPDFHWTALTHVTEWFIITTNSNVSVNLKRSSKNIPDFVTVVSPSSNRTISVHQKSRIAALTKIVSLDFTYSEPNISIVLNIGTGLNSKRQNHVLSSNFKQVYFTNMNQNCERASKTTFNQETISKISDRVRQYGKLFLKQRKSILEGAHLKVPLFVYPVGQDNLVMERKVGNRTELVGYYIRMLQTFAEGLGFTYEFVIVRDSGYYGSVDHNGNYTGIVGHLARREAAFSIIPLTMMEWRLRAIDFVFVSLTTEYSKVIYKLPEPGSALDMTYFDIVQSDLVVIFLVGPLVIMALIGAYLHVVTRSCTSASPGACSVIDLKRLHSFPDHFCFETQRYASQSGRVLKATWGVFWLIFSSAYCAYLTTSLAVKSKELRIDSVEALAKVQGYDIGVNGGMSMFISQLKGDAADPDYRALSRTLHRLNRTNPMTFSDNATYHLNRVRQGTYVFITFGPLPGIADGEFQNPDPLLRTYVLEGSSGQLYVGIVKDAFFKENLYEYTLKMMASGLSDKLKQDIFKTQAAVKDTLVSEETPVGVKRIELVLYTVLACLLVSAGCLVIECAMARAMTDTSSIIYNNKLEG